MDQYAAPSILARCLAIVVAPHEAGEKILRQVGHRAGFGTVVAHDAVGPLASQQIPFFLVHHALSDASKRDLLANIRRAAAQNIRFAPVILFLPDGPAEETLRSITMGFDDVISLPERATVLASRLGNQVETKHLYIETANYLGPDRRRMETASVDNAQRHAGGSSHTRVTLMRRPGFGIDIVNRQQVMVVRQDPAKLRLDAMISIARK